MVPNRAKHPYLKIAFSNACDSFSTKGSVSSDTALFRFSTVFKKKVFKSCAFLASFVKILSFSTGVILSEDIVFSEKSLNSFSRLSSTIFYKELLLSVDYKFFKNVSLL